MRALVAALLFCCSLWPVLAAAKLTVTERVIAVLPDGSVQLETSGKAVFQNILFIDPKLAENWLAEHVLQQRIGIETGEEDRYGRMQIISDVEEKMLQAGVAIIAASEGDISASWRSAEAAARQAKRGVWANKDLLLTPDQAAAHINEFHVVEGKITRIYEAKTATYLNFGKDWHTDFSITIPAKLRRSMKDVLVGLHEGSFVRVRGGIYDENGPMIKLTHADTLEIR